MSEQQFYIRLNQNDDHRYECKDPFQVDDRTVRFTHEIPTICVRSPIIVQVIDLMTGDRVIARVRPRIDVYLRAGSELKIFYEFTLIDTEYRRRQNANMN